MSKTKFDVSDCKNTKTGTHKGKLSLYKVAAKWIALNQEFASTHKHDEQVEKAKEETGQPLTRDHIRAAHASKNKKTKKSPTVLITELLARLNCTKQELVKAIEETKGDPLTVFIFRMQGKVNALDKLAKYKPRGIAVVGLDLE